MASAHDGNPTETRRAVPSPRPKGRENTKQTPCRNITIYGFCRFESAGCMYNHDAGKSNMAPNSTSNPAQQAQAQAQAQAQQQPNRRLAADSPAFTPLVPLANGQGSATPKSTSISPNAANAAVFTPKGSNAAPAVPVTHAKEASNEWHENEFQEFVPQNFDANQYGDGSGTLNPINNFNQFHVSSSVPSLGSSTPQPQINPYSTDAAGASHAAYFASNAGYQQPLQYHLYAPLGPHRENLLAYQLTANDFFIPDELRQELQQKSEATQQVLPESRLPPQIEHFHTLVPIDTAHQKSIASFGYQSWVYKTISSKDGRAYVLRRLENFRLTNEQAIRSVQPWKRINCGNTVTFHDTFTTRAFGDSSLIFVYDYHPRSKTLAEYHFSNLSQRFPAASRAAPPGHVPEQVLWGYIVQIASALKIIHGTGLAARLINPSKIILTSKNRIRLNACAISDVTQFETSKPLSDLQRGDLTQLGHVILAIGTNNANAATNVVKSLESLARLYSDRFKECIFWLISATASTTSQEQQQGFTIDAFLSGIAAQIASTFDAGLHYEDEVTSQLTKELENGRLVRLMGKLNCILERAEHAPGYPNPPPSATPGPPQLHHPHHPHHPHHGVPGAGTHHLGGPGSAPHFTPGGQHTPGASNAAYPGPSMMGGHGTSTPQPPQPASSAAANSWSETGERYYLKLFRDYVFHQVDANGAPTLDLGHIVGCLNKLDAGTDEKIALVSRDEQTLFVVTYRELKRGVESAWTELIKAGGPGALLGKR